jgi:F0F1-type ATP synthase assembly protein I
VIASRAVVSPDTRVARPGERPGRSGNWGTALRDVAPLIGIGSTLAATMLLFLGVGYWLDRRLKTDPWFLFVGGILGMVLALYQFWKTVAGLRK